MIITLLKGFSLRRQRFEWLLSKEPGYRVAIGASAAVTLSESYVPKNMSLNLNP